MDILKTACNFRRLNYSEKELLKARLMLLKIFSYSCMNCVRSMKFIKKLYSKYKNKGLAVIIVHPFEFGFEKNVKNVSEAIKNQDIKFPVIIDSQRRLIKKLGIDFWPAELLIKNKKIVYKNIGEGRCLSLESRIRAHLNINGRKYLISDEPNLSKIPPLYAGYAKNGKVYAAGKWKQKKECLISCGSKNKSLEITAYGKSVNVVAGRKNSPAGILIRIDGKKAKKMRIFRHDMYRIGDFNKAGKRIIRLETMAEGLEIYSFTFE